MGLLVKTANETTRYAPRGNRKQLDHQSTPALRYFAGILYFIPIPPPLFSLSVYQLVHQTTE